MVDVPHLERATVHAPAYFNDEVLLGIRQTAHAAIVASTTCLIWHLAPQADATPECPPSPHVGGQSRGVFDGFGLEDVAPSVAEQALGVSCRWAVRWSTPGFGRTLRVEQAAKQVSRRVAQASSGIGLTDLRSGGDSGPSAPLGAEPILCCLPAGRAEPSPAGSEPCWWPRSPSRSERVRGTKFGRPGFGLSGPF